MMYQNNLVACVKVNGQILRETGSSVALPFGCEYSILIKNLNSVRAQVKISVDGNDATDGTALIIHPNSSIELERFIKGGNLQIGNKFKFIERTAGVEAHRGIGSDDGLIRVEGWRERVPVIVDVPVPHYHPVPSPYWPPFRPYATWMQSTTGGGVSSSATGYNSANVNAANAVFGGQHVNSGPRVPGPRPPGHHPILRGGPLKARISVSARAARSSGIGGSSLKSTRPEPERGDHGITVAGGESRQQFQSVAGFPLESGSTVIVLNLRGEVAGNVVVQPVTVAAKPICGTCGSKNKPGNEFCGKCGAGLIIHA